MPIVDNKYQNPGWNENSKPAINSAELNAMSDSIVSNQTGISENKKSIEDLNKTMTENYATKTYADGTVYSASGVINIVVQNNHEYQFKNVSSLTLQGANVRCHGFILFANMNVTVSVSNFTASSGDDITAAQANEVWEFSVETFNSHSYVIWKNWGAR